MRGPRCTQWCRSLAVGGDVGRTCLTTVYTVSQKCTNFETVWLKIICIDYNDILQKYSKVSRIDFACFSFHVDLLVITLSSLKLQNENNMSMLFISFNCAAHLYLQHFRHRSLWSFNPQNWRPMDPRLTWNFSDCSVALRFVFLLITNDSSVSTFSSVRTLHRLPLPGRLSTVPIFTSSLLMLLFV